MDGTPVQTTGESPGRMVAEGAGHTDAMTTSGRVPVTLLDPSAGAWLAQQLAEGAQLRHEVTRVVPRGRPQPYEAFARIFHPVPWTCEWTAANARCVESLGLVPDRVSTGPGAMADGMTTWAEVAADQGTEVHASAQWADLARGEAGGFATSRSCPGLEYGQVSDGEFIGPGAAALADVLLAHTSTPVDLVLGLWEGKDSLSIVVNGDSGVGADGQDDSVRHPLRSSADEALRTGEGLLSVFDGGRRYLLIGDDGSRLRDPVWGARADLPGEARRLWPNLAWPQDRAWTMATEIDDCWTLVAGSWELIRALCSHPDLEALPIRPDAGLGPFSDTVNGRSPSA